jgi:transcriptional regulator with PAS, ATPase and Fis domain
MVSIPATERQPNETARIQPSVAEALLEQSASAIEWRTIHSFFMTERRTTERPSAAPDREEPEVRITRGLGVDASDPTCALVQRFRLVVAVGPDAGASFVSTDERSVIGTHESADFRLTDPTVSRFHCEIDPTGGKPIVRDLGSRNGTVVGGVSTLAAHLSPGARLVLGLSQLIFEPRSDQAKLPISTHERFGRLVGRSPSMRRVFKLLEQAAATDATVLLEGETGTGKEVAAESLHQASARAAQPFVVVDCGAIPPELLESELFGHERGAFTGASGSRDGAFEEARGGTIFLDEIGELPIDLQPKLLRALDKREVKRVGGNKYFPVDVRIVAATNRDLKKEVNEKRFRADLFYRLAVLRVHIPALRDRLEDLSDLVASVLEGLRQHYPGEIDTVTSPEFLAELARHEWPGNVRELRNYLERCLALRAPPSVRSERVAPPNATAVSIGDLADASRPLKVARERWTRALERHYLEDMLRRSGDNVAAAARAAQVDRMHFYRLLWRHGIR